MRRKDGCRPASGSAPPWARLDCGDALGLVWQAGSLLRALSTAETSAQVCFCRLAGLVASWQPIQAGRRARRAVRSRGAVLSRNSFWKRHMVFPRARPHRSLHWLMLGRSGGVAGRVQRRALPGAPLRTAGREPQNGFLEVARVDLPTAGPSTLECGSPWEPALLRAWSVANGLHFCRSPTGRGSALQTFRAAGLGDMLPPHDVGWHAFRGPHRPPCR